MTTTAVVYSKASSAGEAGRELAAEIAERLPGEAPDAVVMFASPRHDHRALLRSFQEACRPGVLVGASSAGEFTSRTFAEGMVCALALRSSEMRFSASVGRGLRASREEAARQVVAGFVGPGSDDFPFKSALVMTDALAGHADDLIEQLTLATSGGYQFVGGGAGDDAQFQRTPVFFGTEVIEDAVVALEILSRKPIGIGVGHGWVPAGPPMRVTEALGSKLISLNGVPAVEAYHEHARVLGGAPFDPAAPLPFFLHHILGIETGTGHKLRVPLAVDEAGAIACAAEIPVGSTVHIMKTTADSAIEAATRATRAALDKLGDDKPSAALFFDCVATRLRMGSTFDLELSSLAAMLGDADYVGCNTHGQIARAAGQFGGFHNCTAVVCVFPS